MIFKGYSAGDKFIVGAWIPYWKKSEGWDAVKGEPWIFNELSPFAFEASADGSLVDTLKINEEPWLELSKVSGIHKIPVIPTIFSGDADAIHNLLSDSDKRRYHIGQILNLLASRCFSGVDIDYEGKYREDKEMFSVFIVELSSVLKSKGYYLSCAVEARTTDYPPKGWEGRRAMAWANDFLILGRYCDSVRIMVYDQMFQVKGAKEWVDLSGSLYAPNSDILWVEQVVNYMKEKVEPRKIVLGIPTYGWEYQVKTNSQGREYKKEASISYVDAKRLAESYGVFPQRGKDGELHFNYKKSGEDRLVWFSDKISVEGKISLAQKHNLGGVILFKMDGLGDPEILSCLCSLGSLKVA